MKLSIYTFEVHCPDDLHEPDDWNEDKQVQLDQVFEDLEEGVVNKIHNEIDARLTVKYSD